MQSFNHNNSSTPVKSKRLELVSELGEKLLKTKIYNVARVAGGGNNHIYKLQSKSADYALKTYRQDAFNQRDRFCTETDALRFMSDNGMTNIPSLVATSNYHRLAIFEWIHSQPDWIKSYSDIDASVDFIGKLQSIKMGPGIKSIRVASEACFSLGDIESQIDERLARLRASINPEKDQDRDCLTFLNRDFDPVFRDLIANLKTTSSPVGLRFLDRPAEKCPILSPSDFGFHNALKSEAGRIVFIDFEYFGWDDPAKLICDFILHPGMQLSREMGNRFAEGIIAVFEKDRQLSSRYRQALPIYALRWCLIMLNVFVRSYNELSALGTKERDSTTSKSSRLFSAKEMLHRVINKNW